MKYNPRSRIGKGKELVVNGETIICYKKMFIFYDGYYHKMTVRIKNRIYSVIRLVAEAYLTKEEGCDYLEVIDNNKPYELDNLHWTKHLKNIGEYYYGE